MSIAASTQHTTLMALDVNSIPVRLKFYFSNHTDHFSRPVEVDVKLKSLFTSTTKSIIFFGKSALFLLSKRLDLMLKDHYGVENMIRKHLFVCEIIKICVFNFRSWRYPLFIKKWMNFSRM